MTGSRQVQCGEALTAREVLRGLKINVVAGCLGMGWVAVAFGVTLTMFLEQLGASGLQIGLLVTAQQLAMLVQVPASLVAERLSARKPFWGLTTLVHRLLWFVPAAVPFLFPGNPARVVWVVLAVVTVSSILAQAATPVWFSWMADLVPAAWTGRFWGWRQSIVMVSFLVVTGGAGWLLDVFGAAGDPDRALRGFSLVLTLAAVLGAADILVHLFVPEPPPDPVPAGQPVRHRIREPFRNPDFVWLTLCIGVWFFSVGLFGSFAMVYLKRDFAATYAQLSGMSIAGSVGAIAAGLALGPLMDRFGARRIGGILLVVGPLLNLAWFGVRASTCRLGPWVLPQPVVLMGAMNVLTGGLYSGIGLVQIKLLQTFSQSRGRTMAMGAHWTVVGIFGALGPVAGGVILDGLTAHPLPWHLPTGVPFSFFHAQMLLHVATAVLVAMPLLHKVRRLDSEAPLRPALSRLVIGNPLRIVGRLYYSARGGRGWNGP